jgi:hypothetical protein
MDGTVRAHIAFPVENIDIVRIVRGVSGTPIPTREVRETLPVVWVRTTETKAFYLLNDRELQTGAHYCDSGSILSDVEGLVEQAPGMCETWAITKSSDVEYALYSRITDSPTFGPVADDRWTRNAYSSMPSSEGFWRDVPETGLMALDMEERGARVLRPIVHSRTKVWSSRWSEEENKAACEAYRARVAEQVRTTGETESSYCW